MYHFWPQSRGEHCGGASCVAECAPHVSQKAERSHRDQELGVRGQGQGARNQGSGTRGQGSGVRGQGIVS